MEDNKGDLISRSELKKAITEWFIKERYYHPLEKPQNMDEVVALGIVDNALAVPLPDFKEGYKQAILDGKTNFSRPQDEWVRKEDIIHYIATQYSEHNELVPVWLNIGDLKGEAK